MIAEALVPGRRGAVAFLSSTNRDGDWILPRSFRVVAFMGNVELDLTNVRLGSGESHIEIRCIFGNVEITVPPGIRIEVEGDPFIGTFEVTRSAPSTTAPDALLDVNGQGKFVGLALPGGSAPPAAAVPPPVDHPFAGEIALHVDATDIAHRIFTVRERLPVAHAGRMTLLYPRWEAASHEAGHNLGLSHDGTRKTGYYAGHGDWAPIMGVGYYREVSQWSTARLRACPGATPSRSAA